MKFETASSRWLTAPPGRGIVEVPSLDSRPERTMTNGPSLSRRVVAAAVIGTAAVISCTERTTLTPPLRSARDGSQRDVLVAGQLMVCKKGGSPGTYTFHVDISGGGDWTVFASDFSLTFDGTTLKCLEAAAQTNPASWTPGLTSTVTVTELVPPGMHVDSIEVDRKSVV